MGNDQIGSEKNYLEVQAEDKTEGAVKMEPKRKCSNVKPSLERASVGVEAPEQSHISSKEVQPIPVGGCWHADARGLVQGGSIFFL